MEESNVAIALVHGAIALPGLPSGLEHLAELVSLASLALGVLLSINAGRGFARRIHDVELARRHGEKLPGIGLLAYISLLLALMCNLAAFTASKTLSSIASLMGSIPLGGVASHLASLAVTVAVTLASYRFYAARYRGLDEPLTREGRLVLKSLGKASSAKKAVERKLGRKRDSGKEV
ncbi:hypothetical protein [Pyrodictium abyssi]|uniref:Uncharacterized protein n=1 Tax=Pyrodictium abyssi TaxID=54256 RepID=A0ABM8IY16_9CREN|nr:hypothetical protein PABY_19940 [Pyrodictium abyssi]